MINDNNGFDMEVIYYSKAMDYLSKNDPSLQESLSIAYDMGFTVDSLNSELLASLLLSENVKNDFYQLENDINDFFEDLAEDLKNDFNDLANDINDFIKELLNK